MKEDFKNIIKETAGNHSDDINPDMIWAGIESKLGPQKKKRFGGYWILGGLSLVAATLLYISTSTGASIETEDSVQFANNEKEISEVILKDNTTTEPIKEEVITISSNVVANEIGETEIAYAQNDASSLSISGQLNDPMKIKKSPSTDIVVVASDNEVVIEVFTDIVSEVSYVDQQEILNEDQIVRLEDEAGNDITNYRRDLESREALAKTSAVLLELDYLELVKRDVELESFDPFVFQPMYEGDEKSISFLTGLELYSGLSFGDKTVSDLDQSYAKIRNDSEQFLEQWSAGVRVDLVNVLDFQIKSGLRYSMITDKMQRENEYKDLTEYSYVTSRLIDGAIVLIDSMTVVDSNGQNMAYTTKQYNSQRVVSIPLEVSFGRSIERFNVGVGFGIDVNYHLSDTHVILDQEGNASVNKVGGKWESPSFSGSLLAGYHINDNWSITSRVNFRGLTLSDHETISTLKSNYKLYGLEFGLKRNFGR